MPFFVRDTSVLAFPLTFAYCYSWGRGGLQPWACIGQLCGSPGNHMLPVRHSSQYRHLNHNFCPALTLYQTSRSALFTHYFI